MKAACWAPNCRQAGHNWAVCWTFTTRAHTKKNLHALSLIAAYWCIIRARHHAWQGSHMHDLPWLGPCFVCLFVCTPCHASTSHAPLHAHSPIHTQKNPINLPLDNLLTTVVQSAASPPSTFQTPLCTLDTPTLHAENKRPTHPHPILLMSHSLHNGVTSHSLPLTHPIPPAAHEGLVPKAHVMPPGAVSGLMREVLVLEVHVHAGLQIWHRFAEQIQNV
jgi:hypothetical protein